jgi:hypothetical protein
MFKPRKQRPFAVAVPLILRRRLSLVILALVLYIVFHYLPFSSRNNRIVSGKWLPDYDVEDAPRYLHHSSFRVNPDRAFERRVSEALQQIEKDVLRKDGGSRRVDDRIWQIRLGNHPEGEERGSDSLKFEEKNHDWQYTVSL